MGVAPWAVGAVLVVSIGACAADESTSPPGGSAGGGGSSVVDGPAYVVDCHTLCDAMVERGCDDESCAPSCVSANESAGSCAATLGAYVDCLATNVDTIPNCYDIPHLCETAYFDWAACVSEQTGTCGPLKCDPVEMGECSCWAVCGAETIRETCVQTEHGTRDCTCSVDGDVVHECPGAPASCAFFVGCCQAFL